jgi:nicotinate-nucleotide adenylyltransferase
VGQLGILGGTFNPPHLGHRALAQHAREQLGLQHVLLMPAYVSPHKADASDPGPERRLEMCRLLIGDADGLSVCDLEIERGGASYTVDTLEALHASHPDAELTFIVGADTASTLPAWHDPARLLELASLAVAERAGSTRRQVLDRVASVGRAAGGVTSAATVPSSDSPGDATSGRRGCVRFVEMPVIEISSSSARERAARGLPIDGLVGPAVARYIAEHGLYGSRTGASA